MFQAVGQELRGDHLDLSFHETGSWTKVGPSEEMPPSLWVSLGDEAAGPAIQVWTCLAAPQDRWLDTHYHASDQFRVMVQGDFNLQRRKISAGDFGYQASGVPYREGLVGGSTEELWMFAVQAVGRGARSTVTRTDGSFVGMTVDVVADDQLDLPVDSLDDPYWDTVAGGAKGVSALALGTGRVVGGFAWGSFSDRQGWQTLSEGVEASIGLLGDKTVGPIIAAMHVEAGKQAIPAAICDTEIVLAIIGGTVSLGERSYGVGEVRIQRASTPLEAVIAGPAGADIVYMIADRRAIPRSTVADATADQLLQRFAELTNELASTLELAA